MKSIYSILIFFLLGTANAQTPIWSWVQIAGGGAGYSLTTDVKGNVYATGAFTTPIIVFGTDTLINSGINNVFVAKYDSIGNLIWAESPTQWGQNDQIGGQGICTDANGNVYVTGYYYSSSLVFQGIPVNGTNGFFLVKYDPNGNPQWVQEMAGHIPVGISTDNKSNVYITGEIENQIFVIKYDSSGNEKWLKLWGSSSTVESAGEGIKIDASGNIYISGVYYGTIVFGIDTLTGGDDAFVAKLDSLGNPIWAKSSKGNTQNGAVCLSIDTSANSYITGSFSDTIIFGTDTLTNGTYSNMFIVKYDSSGNVVWAKSPADTGWCWGFGISAEANGNTYVTGQYYKAVAFGMDTLIAAWYYTFVAKYDPLGNPIWAINASGVGDNSGQAVCIDGSGNIFVTGRIGGSTKFGNDSFNYISNPDFTVFVAKIVTPNIDTVISSPTNFAIYPNPSNGAFYFSGVQIGSQIEVYNVLGKMVCSTVANSEIYSVNLNGLAQGIYIYRARDSKSNVRQGKMVLE